MKLLIKAGIVFFLILFLLIPLLLVIGLADERKSNKHEVVAEIATNFGKSQRIITPYLYISYEKPFVHRENREKINDKGVKVSEEVTSVSFRSYEYYIPPTQLNGDGKLKVEKKYRRIYSTPVYVGDFDFNGSFKLNDKQLEALRDKDLKNIKAYVEFRVSDTKGLRGNITVTAAGKQADFEQVRTGKSEYDYDYGSSSSKIRAEIPSAGLIKGDTVDFAVKLPINGSSTVSFVPTGLATTINLEANWPHPSFYGNHLPETRTITDEDFTATWSTSWLSGQLLDKNGYLNTDKQDPLRYNSEYEFGADLIDTVDIYSLVNRAVKYGFLIIVLTFLTIFMLEVLTDSRVHPVQYGLTGVALVIFYLLLLSLSEHLSFGPSYFIAAAACIVLIAFYLYFSFKNIRRTAIFTALLTVLYGVIYLLLNVSDYALLLGSGLIFAVIAVVMVSTRKIDWYTIGEKK